MVFTTQGQDFRAFRAWPPSSSGDFDVINTSTTSAKLIKAWRHRQNAFIVLRCLEPLMKYKARVVDITSQKKVEWRALSSINESLFFTWKYENPVMADEPAWQLFWVEQIPQCTLLAYRAPQTNLIYHRAPIGVTSERLLRTGLRSNIYGSLVNDEEKEQASEVTR